MELDRLIVLITNILTFAIVGRAILSWFPDMQQSSLGQALFKLTEPILSPFRRIIPRIANIDLSAIVAILVIQFVGKYLANSV